MDKKPSWIRNKISLNDNFYYINNLLKNSGLNTVCIEALCPNRGECWSKKHITFMILGDICTRACNFCNVKKGIPKSIDKLEGKKIAQIIKKIDLKYVVITSVTRDDLKDKGVNHYLDVIEQIKGFFDDVIMELLIPDFDADATLIKKIAFSQASVIGHNIEMPKKFYKNIRPVTFYDKTLEVLNLLNINKKKGANIFIKSGIMVGFGESIDDIIETLQDIKKVGTDIVYIGQYLMPSKEACPVKKYYSLEEFKFLKDKARDMGFSVVCSLPLVRSSYCAYDSFLKAKNFS